MRGKMERKTVKHWAVIAMCAVAGTNDRCPCNTGKRQLELGVLQK